MSEPYLKDYLTGKLPVVSSRTDRWLYTGDNFKIIPAEDWEAVMRQTGFKLQLVNKL